jgi:hypothetical protein
MKLILALILATTAVTAQANDFKAKKEAEVKACIDRGYSYYKEALGYTPTSRLMNGRIVADEVRIRCERQPKTAF